MELYGVESTRAEVLSFHPIRGRPTTTTRMIMVVMMMMVMMITMITIMITMILIIAVTPTTTMPILRSGRPLLTAVSHATGYFHGERAMTELQLPPPLEAPPGESSPRPHPKRLSSPYRGPVSMHEEGCETKTESPDDSENSTGALDDAAQMMTMPRKVRNQPYQSVRPPLALIVGVAGAGKSTLGSAILGKREFRVVFKVGVKTTCPRIVVGEKMAVLDTPGLPDPYPASSEAYYDETVQKLRSVGYVNAMIFVINQERVTSTLIKNYGILYRAFNKLACVKIFVLRRESSFVLLNLSEQDRIAAEGKETVNRIMEASRLKRWRARQFFILTNGRGDEQDKQVSQVREQVRISPVVTITPETGLRTTSENTAIQREDGGKSALDFEPALSPVRMPGRPKRQPSRRKQAPLEKSAEKQGKRGCTVM